MRREKLSPLFSPPFTTGNEVVEHVKTFVGIHLKKFARARARKATWDTRVSRVRTCLRNGVGLSSHTYTIRSPIIIELLRRPDQF